MNLHTAWKNILLLGLLAGSAQAKCDRITAEIPCTVKDIEKALTENSCPPVDEELIAEACKSAAVQFGEITDNHYQFDKSYMDGGSIWNDVLNSEHDTDEVSVDEDRIRRVKETVGSTTAINWPEYEALQDYVGEDNTPYMSNFNLDESCDLNTVMCCFTDKKQGNLDDYDVTNLCSHDLADSRRSNHIQKGWAEYDSAAYCTGFTFSQDANDATNRYKGNSLFALSFLNTYDNDLIKNVPGAPMCACIEKMPSVEKADCIETTVTNEVLTFSVTAATDTEEASITVHEISAVVGHKACGTGLKEHASTTYGVDLASKLVGEGCDDERKRMRNEKFWVEGTSERHEIVDDKKWQIVVGNHLRAYPIPYDNFELGKRGDYGIPLKVTDDAFKAAVGADKSGEDFEPFIIRRVCDSCASSHIDVYYKRFTPVPSTMNFLNLFMNAWNDADNKRGVDFNIYSTYEDAVAGVAEDEKAWKFTNFNHNNIGFPRDSGPTGYVWNQWNSYRQKGGDATTHAFYYEIKTEV